MSTVFCPSCHRQSPAQAGDETTSCEHCQRPLLLHDRWWLCEMLGHGASGYTWRAEDDNDGAVVAIKELSFRRLTDLKQLELFDREADALASLDHPGIPDYIDRFVIEEDRFVSAYLVQEFIDGDVLRAGERTDEDEVLRFLEEMADILEHLQSRRPPVIHRDIKPSNLMRRSDGSYVLIDFGSIRATIEATNGGSTVAGTLGYMAPEQLVGRATAASDYYGLGATALALLAGRQAHHLIEHHQPGQWRQEVTLSEPIGELIEALLEAHADDRLQTPQALRAAIEDIRNPPRRADPTPRIETPPSIQLSQNLRDTSERIRSPSRRADPTAGNRHPTSSNTSSEDAAAFESARSAFSSAVKNAHRWASQAPLLIAAVAVAALIFGVMHTIPWLVPETLTLFTTSPAQLGSYFLGLAPLFFLWVPYMLITSAFMMIDQYLVKQIRVIPLPGLLVLEEDYDAISKAELYTHIAALAVFIFIVHIGALSVNYQIDEIYLVESESETRLLREFSCGFDILTSEGKRHDAYRQRGTNCENEILSQGLLKVQKDHNLVLLDAFSGEVLYSVADEFDERDSFRVDSVDGTAVAIELRDGSRRKLDFGHIQSTHNAQVVHPHSLMDDSTEALEKALKSAIMGIPPEEGLEKSLHRPTKLIPSRCGCATCGPVVEHYTTAFGDGDRLYSGLDANGKPRWTRDSLGGIHNSIQTAYTAGDQCWLFIPRSLNRMEFWSLAPQSGDLERILRY